jgi:GAF domain-containing protein
MTEARDPSEPDRQPILRVVAETDRVVSDEVTAAIDDLSGMLLAEQDLHQTLQHVVDLAVRAVPGCTGASVTLLGTGDQPGTAAYTDELVLTVDMRQYDADEGPCLDAARNQRRNLVDLREADDRWPDFTSSAAEAGVLSFLASPLIAGGEGIGALNLYSTSPDGFDQLDQALVDLFAAQASVALANAQVYARCRALTEQLTEAIGSRAVIEQAKGALMVTSKVSEQEAFDLLRLQSQRANHKLREVAEQLLSKLIES